MSTTQPSTSPGLKTHTGAHTVYGPDQIDIAVAALLDILSKHPAAAGTLLPGYTIAPLPMTPAARAAMSLPKATAQRRAKNQERLARVWQVIDREVIVDPDISDDGLAVALNRASVLTYMGLPYTASKVRLLLNQREREGASRHAGAEDRAPEVGGHPTRPHDAHADLLGLHCSPGDLAIPDQRCEADPSRL